MARLFQKPEDSWEAFYQLYPHSGGYLMLSPVGFTPEKDVAVVEVGHRCGLLCGGGAFFVLQKSEGVWTSMPGHVPLCMWFS